MQVLYHCVRKNLFIFGQKSPTRWAPTSEKTNRSDIRYRQPLFEWPKINTFHWRLFQPYKWRAVSRLITYNSYICLFWAHYFWINQCLPWREKNTPPPPPIQPEKSPAPDCHTTWWWQNEWNCLSWWRKCQVWSLTLRPWKEAKDPKRKAILKPLIVRGYGVSFLLAAVTQLDPLYSWKSPATLDFGSHKTHPKKGHNVLLVVIFFPMVLNWRPRLYFPKMPLESSGCEDGYCVYLNIYTYPEVVATIKKTSWWLNQPIWKICSSNWIICPGRVENQMNIKNVWNHHLEKVVSVLLNDDKRWLKTTKGSFSWFPTKNWVRMVASPGPPIPGNPLMAPEPFGGGDFWQKLEVMAGQ